MDRFALARLEDWMWRFGPVQRMLEHDRYRAWLASSHPTLYAQWSDAVSAVRFDRDHAASLRDGLLRRFEIQVFGAVEIEIIGPYFDRAFSVTLQGVTHVELPRMRGLGAEVFCHYVLPLYAAEDDETGSAECESAYVLELDGERPLVVLFKSGVFSERVFDRPLTREALFADFRPQG